MFSLFLLSAFFVQGSPSFSQTSLYMPIDVKYAYDQGTRSFDGSPGPNYWQNSADYTITASIDPATRLLKGSEKIVYRNNSPETLTRLVFKAYQNLNKYGMIRNRQLVKEAVSDGLIIKSAKVNGENYDVKNIFERETNLSMNLRKPLGPSESIKLEFEWEFVIPKGSNIRMGTYDRTSFYIAYWYPQVAVYDDIDGWDELSYNGEQEMYNDFNNFDVKITMPADFGVWATGTLQNKSEVLNSEYLDKYNKSLSSNEVINIITNDDLIEKRVYKNSNGSNTWHYKAESVTDFAFGTSDHYLWDASSVEIEPGRRTHVSAVYKKESTDFADVVEISKESIDFLSGEFPAVRYPFPSLTVFNGAGGMEFPMIINQGSYSSLARTVNVTSHEVAHMYFPFFVGTNERKYSWMDEGMAQMMPFELQERMVKGNDEVAGASNYYKFLAGRELELPLMTPSIMMRGLTLTVASYMRSALAYHFLREGLGKDVYDPAFREYINRWKWKHPIPYDYFFTISSVSGQNLDWYWKPWFFESGYPDLAVKEVDTGGEKVRILIEKVGNIPIPISLVVNYADGSEEKIYKDVMVWKDGGNQTWIETGSDKQLSSVILNNYGIPDINIENDIYNVK